jgi:hypothetical protein
MAESEMLQFLFERWMRSSRDRAFNLVILSCYDSQSRSTVNPCKSTREKRQLFNSLTILPILSYRYHVGALPSSPSIRGQKQLSSLPLPSILRPLRKPTRAILHPIPDIRNSFADVLPNAPRSARNRLSDSAARGADDAAYRIGEAADLSKTQEALNSSARWIGARAVRGRWRAVTYGVAEGAGDALCAFGYAGVFRHGRS